MQVNLSVFSNEDIFDPNVMCRNKNPTNIFRKEKEVMDFSTTTNVVIDYEKNADRRATVLAYDTLFAAKKNEERKERGHA